MPGHSNQSLPSDRPISHNHAAIAYQGHISCSRVTDPVVTDDRTATESVEVSLADFQRLIRDMYFDKDAQRGVDGTFMWLIEEVGELAAALREGTPQQQAEEFADVLAWLTTIANVVGVDLSAAVAGKYGSGCPGCGRFVCTCPNEGKP